MNGKFCLSPSFLRFFRAVRMSFSSSKFSISISIELKSIFESWRYAWHQNSWICEYLIFAKNSKICVPYVNTRDWVSVVWWRILNNRLFNPLNEMDRRFHCVIIFCFHRESKKLISKERVDREKIFF